MYLRQFKKLRLVNLAGNLIAASPDYRSYVLSHIKDLTYLDYRRVNAADVAAAIEQHQVSFEQAINKRLLHLIAGLAICTHLAQHGFSSPGIFVLLNLCNIRFCSDCLRVSDVLRCSKAAYCQGLLAMMQTLLFTRLILSRCSRCHCQAERYLAG